ncbi:MAG: PQQ-binding-like beta-propeller repeat protein [Thermoproteota archaeon]|nr:PQQ-binding-like beta-propeller repeat protein [Thermoproteota archaeon]
MFLLEAFKARNRVLTKKGMPKITMIKPVMIALLFACIIMFLDTTGYAAYGVLNGGVSQSNFDSISPSFIIHTSLAADSRADMTISSAGSNSNNRSSLFHNQTDTEEWLTYHHDFFRTGFDSYNQGAANHNPSSSLSINNNWTSDPLDGIIYAEPLVARNLVFVATTNNTIYSLDSNTGKVIWRTNLGPPVPLSDLPCGNIDSTGIIGTPVIDLQTKTIFAVGFLGNTHSHELFGIDINTGKINLEAPIDPPGSDPLVEQQRGALALSYYNDSNNNTGGAGTVAGRVGGVIVYVPFGGLYGDCGQYHGWVVGAPVSHLLLSSGNNNNTSINNSANSTGVATGGREETKQQLSLMSFQVPTRREAGIWAPSGPAIDRNGSVLVATGNGASKTNFDFGNSVIKLSPNLQEVIDWFAPSNWAELSRSDTDLGSVGPSILGDSNISDQEMNRTHYTNNTSTIFQIGKEGIGYLLRGDKLGGNNGQIFSAPVCEKGAYGATAYASPYLYVPCRDGLVALYLQSAAADSNNYSSFTVKWTGPSSNAGPPIVADGLVWTVNINKGQLVAFDQSTGKILFQQSLGDVAHFSTPSSSHGKIFVAASNKILSFVL